VDPKSINSPLRKMVAAAPSFRSAFRTVADAVKFRAGRLYETFWFSQSNLKWTLVFLYPGGLFYIRWRAEHEYKYNVYIADKDIVPQTEKTVPVVGKQFGAFYNGKSYYTGGMTTVQDFKAAVYNGKQNVPKNIKAGCNGRMFDDSDNLALAVRSFCRRNPQIVLWEEVVDSESK
jgi:hypothetical protein